MKCRDKCLSVVSSFDEQKAIEGEELMKNGKIYELLLPSNIRFRH